MVEPFLSVSLTTHPCYAYHQRLINCIKSEDMVQRMCYNEMEDWFECKNRKKYRAFSNFVLSELDRHKILSLPTYDPHTDTFKDGPLPRDVDAYFSKPKTEQTYYSWRASIKERCWKNSGPLFNFDNSNSITNINTKSRELLQTLIYYSSIGCALAFKSS